MELSPMRVQATRDQTTSTKPKRVWRMKLSLTWNAIRKALSSTMNPHHHLHLSCASSMKQLSLTQINQNVAVQPRRTKKSKKKPSQIGKKSKKPKRPLARLLQVAYSASDFIDRGDQMTPTKSPIENIATNWQEIHGLNNWDGLLDPINPWLRREILKYGDFVEATYDAFDFDPLSEYCGSCRYNRHKLFEELGLTKHGYKVTQYIYAMSHVDVPSLLESSEMGEIWSKDSNWIGYVAVSNDRETERIGRRDILVAWRGTVAPSEWFADLKTKLDHFGEDKKVKVQHGFLGIYTEKGEHTRYNKLSASEQVMQELKRLEMFFREKRGETVSFTLTGHSLGGALALLNAYEAAVSFPDISISVISFGAPRVGNIAFKNKINELGVKTLRVVVKQDLVPKLPGIVFNKILHKLNGLTQKLNWVYRHVGTPLKLDVLNSPYLKRDSDYSGYHNLEIYLHLLDGFFGKKMKFRWSARRDLTLVNKSSDMLIDELRIPEFWYQLPHKGLVLNKYGRWVKPSREPEHIPSPLGIEACNLDFSF